MKTRTKKGLSIITLAVFRGMALASSSDMESDGSTSGNDSLRTTASASEETTPN